MKKKKLNKPLRLVSWNVNGIRAVVKKGFLDFLSHEAPDILCLQETKARPEQVETLFWPPEYHLFWNSADRPGYSGTAILTREKPLSLVEGIGKPVHDKEGRVMTAEYENFYLVNCYTPNSQRELTRLGYRQTWDRVFRSHLRRLDKKKPVLLCGDLNVAHEEIDLARPKENRGNSGFTDEERAAGLVLTCQSHPVSDEVAISYDVHGGIGR